MRAKTFYAERAGLDVGSVDVPVIGGHAGITILPLLSQATPPVNLDPAAASKLVARIQDAGTEVRCRAGAGRAGRAGRQAGRWNQGGHCDGQGQRS